MGALKILARSAAFAVVAAATSGYAQQAHESHVVVMPDDLKWAPSASLPGAMVAMLEGTTSQPGPFILRVKFPAGFKVLPHFHHGIEHVTVLSGTFNLGHGEKYDEALMTAMKPGSVAIMQAKSPHFAMTSEETVTQSHGMGPWSVIYVNPTDDPTKKN